MRIQVTEPDCKHEWYVDNGAIFKPVRAVGGRVRMEFMDSQAYQKGIDNRGNQYRMLSASVDLSPKDARRLASALMTFAVEQEKQQEDASEIENEGS